MKKTILIAFMGISFGGYCQKIGLKFKTQQVTVAAPVIVTTDTIAVNQIIDNGESVILLIRIGTRQMDLIIWSGADYIANQNWTNETVLARLKKLFNIQ